MPPHHRRQPTAMSALVACVAVAAYLNTLVADFTFDDNFAVITNGDVTQDGRAISELFKHDFWGQDIASSQSHKSYRPLTILAFRLTRQAWVAAVAVAPGLPHLLPRPPPVLGARAQEAADASSKQRPQGLHPLPFHVLAVVLHACVSVLVLALARHLFAAHPGHGTAAAAVPGPGEHSTATDGSGSSSRYRATAALLAALMFALHPVHTEAVAGVVGSAELICAALSIPALLLYCQAVDLDLDEQGQQQPDSKQGQQQLRHHWLRVAGAAGLALVAALSKEIGITVVGTMLLYDALLSPSMTQQQQQPRAAAAPSLLTPAACRRQLGRMLLMAAVGAGYVRLRQAVAVQQLVAIYRRVENPIPFAASSLTRALSTAHLHARYSWLLLAPLRLSADWSFACVPLVESLADPRNLASLALYGGCFWVVAAARPLRLLSQAWAVVRCAAGARTDGSSSSSNGGDGRERPAVSQEGASVQEEQRIAAAAAAAAAATARRRWRLFVLLGLLVGPFFPASNVLFYVGTFIGERLLYMPSIGFCLLAAELLAPRLPARLQALAARAMAGSERTCVQGDNSSSTSSGGQQQDQASPRKQHQQTEAGSGGSAPASASARGSWLLAAGVLALLAGYAGRTLTRNQDWWDEERLFLAALRTCPDSAKVQQNCGVVMRRYHRHDDAIAHFRRAQEIEPGYCEPAYWVAVSHMSLGAHAQGLAELEASLGCKYTAGEALAALNSAFVLLHEAGGGQDPGPMVRWAGVLASPHVLRLREACATAEDAAFMAALTGRSSGYVGQAVDACLRGIKHWRSNATLPDTMAGLYKRRHAGLNATLLQRCVKLRLPVYQAFVGRAVGSRPVRRALYKYIRAVSQRHPGCRGMAGGGMPADADGSEPGPKQQQQQQQAAPAGPEKPTSHQVLVNKVQSADAEDPWLQLEWGATLLAVSGPARLKEAAMHLEVAAALFGHAAQQQLAAAQQGGSAGPDAAASKVVVTALDGRTPLTAGAALEAAASTLDVLRAALADAAPAAAQGAPAAAAQQAGQQQQRSSAPSPGTADGGIPQPCDVLQRLCHLRLQAAILARNSGGDEGAAAAAEAAGRACVAELDQPACRAQSEALRRLMVGGGVGGRQQ